MLKPGSAELKLLQRIRDEAHRFAITFHRQIREKKQIESELTQIPGIGPKKRDLLLKIFGTSEKVSKTSFDELCSVAGISTSDASNIISYFNHKSQNTK